MLRDDSIESLRRRARRRLPKAVFDFIDGGAEEEITLHRNLDDFSKVLLLPRSFVNVEHRDLGAMLLGRRAELPLIVGPTGLAALVWPRADSALARATTAAGLPFVVSTSSSMRLEDVRAAAPSTISMLPEIRRAVAKDIEIYIDGGVRRGTDIVKAVASGARAAMIGRATLYGVGAAGPAGAQHALAILRREYDRAMALLGCPDTTALNSTMVRHRA